MTISTTTDNLIANPRAEIGSSAHDFNTAVAPDRWTVTQGSFTAVDYAAFDNTDTPNPNGRSLFSGGPSSSASSAHQVVDVSSFASNIDSGGTTANLSGYFGGFDDQNDNMTLTAHYLSGASADLGSFTVGGVTAADRSNVTELLYETGSAAVPIGTRSIDVTLTATRTTGVYNDGYGDDVSLTLSHVITSAGIAFRNDLTGDVWSESLSNGAFAGWSPISGSNTNYFVVGVGDFDGNGNGTDDILFRDNATGDTWFEAISNGAFAGWHQVGGSNTNYSVVGVGDFLGNGTSDILYRDDSTGDTWFAGMSNGAFTNWYPIGGSKTSYSVVGVGDFDGNGNGTDDILFRDNATGDTWFEAISNGAFAGWQQVGGSNTNYSVVGVGHFFGNGTSDILFRDASTGDTWFAGMSNGAFTGWYPIGGSNTDYSVAGVGDYLGNGTDDILFRNKTTGDTWFAAMSNGNFNGWNQVGGSDSTYGVKA